MSGRLVTFPHKGAYRVHRVPTRVSKPTRPRHRFDDPDNEYAALYFATTLRGALIEVLDHFRTVATAEEKASAITNVTGLDILNAVTGEEHAGSVPAKFLDEQRIVKGYLDPHPGARVLNLVDEDLLASYNLRARVQDALIDGGTKIFGSPPTLNFGNIQSAGRFHRMLTQAVAREVYEDSRRPVGIRYISRHTENEEAWALFDSDERPAPIRFGDDESIDATNSHHRRAVQEAAALLRLSLPSGWVS